MVQKRSRLTEWERQKCGSVRCRLVERDHDGTELIVAEFDREPAPVGEMLASVALATANAYAVANPNSFAEIDGEADQDELYRASMQRQFELKAALEAERLNGMKLRAFKPAGRSAA